LHGIDCPRGAERHEIEQRIAVLLQTPRPQSIRTAGQFVAPGRG
jgi:hypothetical protein